MSTPRRYALSSILSLLTLAGCVRVTVVEPSPSSSPASSTSQPVTPESVPPERALFDPAISAITPWYNDVRSLLIGGSLDKPDNEAPLLGAWWALADWCISSNNGSEGPCYDIAALYVKDYFKRDPRTINTQTWAGAGAIGGVAVDAYDKTARYLGIPEPTLIPVVFKDRPGDTWFCTPSCTAARAS